MQSELGWYDEKLENQIKAENYFQIQQDPDYLSHWQTVIYQIISENPAGICDKAIQKTIWDQFEIRLPMSSINARRNELKQKGLIIAVGFMEYPDYRGVVRKNTLWGTI